MNIPITYTIEQVHLEFLTCCTDFDNNVIVSQENYLQKLNTGDFFNKNMRDLITEYSFVKLYLFWEYFLEQVFIKFCLGYEGVNKKKVVVYITPRDLDHAYNMIRGNNAYPDWTSVDKVLKSANDYFENGATFEILKLGHVDLTDMKVIRNSLSHMSINSKGKI
jgi:hypothetical protein